MFSQPVIFKELFKGFTVLRWNDKLRPVEFIEMDKHAHKMIIAWCLAKYEERNGRSVNWENIIKGGVYELLRRIVIRDIKSPIFFKIKKDYKDAYRILNQWVLNYFEQLNLDKTLLEELRLYIVEDDLVDDFSRYILNASHKYSSYLEFLLIKQINPYGYEIEKIDREMLKDIEQFLELEGIRRLITKQKISDFVELCGQLRFQVRWSQTPRIPRTSVLGHSMFVASATYFLTRDNNPCPRRLYNNFFGGLFHDLPEAVTRDIISPVKTSSEDFEAIIKDIEDELAEKEIYPLLEPEWVPEIRYFTQNEFNNKIVKEGEIINVETVDEITNNYNQDLFNPYDGQLIRAADHMSAFLEAKSSIDYGISSNDLQSAIKNLRNQYQKRIGNINFGDIYNEL
ncbi:HD domain-containing protein [Bacteroidetes/Chlorobi group bacterium Naka2016]|jgi:putative hydrolase of HD superfamily|nr:MAG: HD domain-containing protein [Bacteroidetes/Chlorobi group bacterium Naka2016]